MSKEYLASAVICFLLFTLGLTIISLYATDVSPWREAYIHV